MPMIRQPMTGSERDLATYADEGFGRRLIAETADGKVVLVAFRPGHSSPSARDRGYPPTHPRSLW